MFDSRCTCERAHNCSTSVVQHYDMIEDLCAHSHKKCFFLLIEYEKLYNYPGRGDRPVFYMQFIVIFF